MNNLLSSRLRTAREASGLSLHDLSVAMHSCVSRQCLSKYEHGIMRPGPDNLDAISRALHIPASYLLGTGMTIDIPRLRTSAHRTLSDNELVEMESVILFHAERFRLKADLLGISTGFSCSLLGRKICDTDDASSAADSLRREWSCGDGPIPSMLRLFERHGIFIFEYALPDSVLGLSTWVDGKYPLVILDTRREKTTVERLRFTAAHELAHLLFSFPDGSDVEKLCNKFAGLFLFPQSTFIQEIGGLARKELYLEELIDLHETYGVSVAALVHEAFDLGVIGREHYDYWFDEVIKKNPKEDGWGKYLFPETLGRERRMDVRLEVGEIIIVHEI